MKHSYSHNITFGSSNSQKPKKGQQNQEEAFYGKRYLCAYCGTQFNEAACPGCASTTYTDTPEYVQWKNAVHVTKIEGPNGTVIHSTQQINDPVAQKKFLKMFLIIFFSVFIGIWVLVLAIFLLNFTLYL